MFLKRTQQRRYIDKAAVINAGNILGNNIKVSINSQIKDV